MFSQRLRSLKNVQIFGSVLPFSPLMKRVILVPSKMRKGFSLKEVNLDMKLFSDTPTKGGGRAVMNEVHVSGLWSRRSISFISTISNLNNLEALTDMFHICSKEGQGLGPSLFWLGSSFFGWRSNRSLFSDIA